MGSEGVGGNFFNFFFKIFRMERAFAHLGAVGIDSG